MGRIFNVIGFGVLVLASIFIIWEVAPKSNYVPMTALLYSSFTLILVLSVSGFLSNLFANPDLGGKNGK